MDIRSIGVSTDATLRQQAEDKKLKAACRDMEAVFLNILLSRMRATVPKSDLTGSKQQELLQSMLDTELTQNMARAGGSGLADMLYRQLTQPVQKPEPVKE